MDMHFHGVIYQTHARELSRRVQYPHPPFLIVDVRDSGAFDLGHIAGAVRAQPDKLSAGLPEGCSTATEFFVVGADPKDTRVREASLALRAHGALRCVEFSGGMREWLQSGYGVESGRSAA